MKRGAEIWKNIAMLSQFSLSFITPLLLCLAGCWWLAAKAGVGGCVYIPAFSLEWAALQQLRISFI